MRYVKDTDFGSLEIRKNEAGARFVTIASIAEMLEANETILTDMWKRFIRKPDGEPSLPLVELTSRMAGVGLKHCGLGRASALTYLQKIAADEIADMILPSSKGEVVATVMPQIHALIDIQPHRIGREETNSVGGEQLHSVLKSKVPFPVWIERVLQRHIEHVEYEKVITDTAVLYIISTDTAKHIAMQEGTPEGREIRNYFIECEKQLQRGGVSTQQLDALSAHILSTFQVMWDEQKQYQRQTTDRLERIEASLTGGYIPVLRSTVPEEGITMTAAARRLNMSARCDNPSSLSCLMESQGWIQRRHVMAPWSATEMGMLNGYLVRGLQQVRLTPQGVNQVRSILSSRLVPV